MNLFEIDRSITDCIDIETGEIVDIDRLHGLEMERDRKIRNIACWIKNLRADAQALKEQKDIFAARQKVAENKAERLKEYLTEYLDGKSIKDTEYSISFRATKSANILNEEAVPEKYKVPQPAKVSKADVLLDLKNGIEVPGAELKEGYAMTLK